MAPLEPWEKVLVDEEAFPGTTHALNGCTDCHGGVQSPDKQSAHEGLVSAPSSDPEATCGKCHPDVVVHNQDSLHTNLAGYWTVLEERSVPSNHPQISEAFDNHCASCHATCGDCHVSQPATVGGGFISGHTFNRTPSMTRNCTACHGSRVGNEFLGKHEGLNADVHFREGRMTCNDCHTNSEMHGASAECDTCHPGPEGSQLPPPDYRYSGVQSPRCETCHAVVTTGEDEILLHQLHGSKLSCQVCHSVSYTNCDGCHVAVSETTGNPFFETEGSYQTFLIGRNTLNSFDRPYEYVPVRHAPVSATSFEYYGQDLLPNFDNLETWKYATPHNIQRQTPQTESCTNCHENPDIFLTADKVKPEELQANLGVIVEEVPASIAELMQGNQ